MALSTKYNENGFEINGSNFQVELPAVGVHTPHSCTKRIPRNPLLG